MIKEKFNNVKYIIFVSLMILFLMSNLTYANDAEKEYKKFIKETNKIRKQLDKLPTETSNELTVINEAIKELDQAFDFAKKNFKENKIEITKMTLDYIDKSLADISKLAPKEFSNDLSVIDMKSLPKENFQEIMETSKQMKIIKNEKITSLVENMTIVEKQGLNLFQVSKNLNELGVNTLNFEDIAKVVSENSSLKEDVLNASKKGISEEDYTKQLETIAEAERL